jgi:hypothetical protein
MTHGTYTAYTRHGCRCEPCTEANRNYVRPRPRKGEVRFGMIEGLTPQVAQATEGRVGIQAGINRFVSYRIVKCASCGVSKAANSKLVQGRIIEKCYLCR